MPPPPAIGSARPPLGEPEPGPGARAAQGAAEAKETAPDESATQRWTALGVEIAEDDGPTDDVGSRSLPLGAKPPRAPSPPAVSPAAGPSGLKVPPADASTSATSLKVPSLGPPTAVGAASESAGSWPRTDGWDLDEPGSDDASASVPSVPKPAAITVPSVPKLGAAKEPGSVPSVPKLGSIPSIPKPTGAATKDAGGSVPSVPKLGSVPSVPKPTASSVPKLGAAKEPGSVPSVPKLGGSKPAPLPRIGGGSRPAPGARHGRAAEVEEDVKPLFGTALTDDGSLAAGLGAGAKASAEPAEPPLDAWASFSPSSTDAAAIDALAPPSSASPLDALPSFDVGPPGDGVPQDGFPSLDSSMLLGAALEPVGDFEPAPVQAGLAPLASADDDDPAPSVPRLPIPGMLRDGFAPAADFRATPRTPRSPQPPPAMATPRGMIPPKLREGEEPRLKPGDTQALVAQVTEELIEELDRERAEKAAAAAAMVAAAAPPAGRDHEAAVPVAAAAASARPAARPAAASAVPLASADTSTRASESKRRGMMVGIGATVLTVAIGSFVWLQSNRDPEPSTQTAAATTASPPATPGAAGGAAVKAEPPDPTPPDPTPPEPTPVVAPAAEVAASTSGSADEAAAASTGEPAPEGEAGAEAPSDAEATPEPTDSGSGSSSRKSSGKSGRAGGKSTSGDTAKDEPATPPPAKDDAPTAAKLLKQARSAYNAGKGSTAYSLASKSNRMEPTGEAAEVMALAACQMNDANKAKSALRTVPLFSRASVRNTCKTKHGVKLGL